MISGNRRIPLVYSNQKAKDPVYMKYSPGSSRTVRIACICIPPIPPVVPTEATYYYDFTGDTTPSSGYVFVISPGTKIRINVTDSSLNNQSLFLNQLSLSTTIVITSIATPSTHLTFSVSSGTNQGSYWEYIVTLASSNGALSPPELVKITYS